MGAWGGGLYDSDFARDLKATIKGMLRAPLSDDEVLRELWTSYGKDAAESDAQVSGEKVAVDPDGLARQRHAGVDDAMHRVVRNNAHASRDVTDLPAHILRRCRTMRPGGDEDGNGVGAHAGSHQAIDNGGHKRRGARRPRCVVHGNGRA